MYIILNWHSHVLDKTKRHSILKFQLNPLNFKFIFMDNKNGTIGALF